MHRGTEFTLGNFAEVLRDDRVVEAFVNSALISTLATVLLAAGDGVERLHAVALQRAGIATPGSAPSMCSAACPIFPGCCRSIS